MSDYMMGYFIFLWLFVSGWVFFGEGRMDYDFSGQLTGLAMLIFGVGVLLGWLIF